MNAGAPPVVRPPEAPAHPIKWAKVIDHTRCIGCHACTTACKSENEVPLSVTRTRTRSAVAPPAYTDTPDQANGIWIWAGPAGSPSGV